MNTEQKPQKSSGENPASQKREYISLRTATRLKIVQWLYAMENNNLTFETVLENLKVGFLDDALPDIHGIHSVDLKMFETNMRGILVNQQEINERLVQNLPEQWKITRLDKVTRAILRAAVYELFHCSEVPAKVVVNEYTNLAAAMNVLSDNNFVNGFLHNLAKKYELLEVKA